MTGMSLLQKYIDWHEARLIRKHNGLKREEPFAWGLSELGLDAAASDPAQTLSEYVKKHLAASDEFYALPAQIEYSRAGSQLTFPSTVEVDSPSSKIVHARVYAGARSDHGVVIVPHWNARGEIYDALAWLIHRVFGITVARISLPGHDRRAAGLDTAAREVCSANLGRTIRSVRQSAVDVSAVARWLHSQGCSSIALVGASLGSCVGTLSMAHEPLITSACFVHSCASFGEAVWTGAATQHVRRAVEKHLALRQLAAYWDLISPGSFVPKLASRATNTTIISARNDAVFIPELTARLRLIYKRSGVPLRHVVVPCGHYSIGSFPFGLAAMEAIMHHLQDWMRVRTARPLPLRVLHALPSAIGLSRVHA